MLPRTMFSFYQSNLTFTLTDIYGCIILTALEYIRAAIPDHSFSAAVRQENHRKRLGDYSHEMMVLLAKLICDINSKSQQLLCRSDTVPSACNFVLLLAQCHFFGPVTASISLA